MLGQRSQLAERHAATAWLKASPRTTGQATRNPLRSSVSASYHLLTPGRSMEPTLADKEMLIHPAASRRQHSQVGKNVDASICRCGSTAKWTVSLPYKRWARWVTSSRLLAHATSTALRLPDSVPGRHPCRRREQAPVKTSAARPMIKPGVRSKPSARSHRHPLGVGAQSPRRRFLAWLGSRSVRRPLVHPSGIACWTASERYAIPDVPQPRAPSER